jgi:hypothetical protein
VFKTITAATAAHHMPKATNTHTNAHAAAGVTTATAKRAAKAPMLASSL